MKTQVSSVPWRAAYKIRLPIVERTDVLTISIRLEQMIGEQSNFGCNPDLASIAAMSIALLKEMLILAHGFSEATAGGHSTDCRGKNGSLRALFSQAYDIRSVFTSPLVAAGLHRNVHRSLVHTENTELLSCFLNFSLLPFGLVFMPQRTLLQTCRGWQQLRSFT